MGKRRAPWQSPPVAEERDVASTRVWRRREISTGLTAGLVVAVFSVAAQAVIDDRREAQADRREDVRFVRQLAADGTAAKGSLRGLDLSESNLSGLDLAGADLTGSNLSGSDLTGTRLIGATLSRADLSGSRLENVVLVGARMDEVNLADADLIHPVFHPHALGEDAVKKAEAQGVVNANRVVDMSDANLSGATIRGAQFKEVSLRGADFSGAIFDNNPEDPFSRSTLREAFLAGTKFYGTDLSHVGLPSAFDRRIPSLHEEHGMCADASTTWPEMETPPHVYNPGKCEDFGAQERSDQPPSPALHLSGLPASAMKPLP